MSGSRPGAEDLVQDAFVRMYGAADRLDEAGMLAYARRTIVNLHASALRRMRRRRTPPDAGPTEVDVPAREDVRSALLGLPPSQRACLALRYLEDLPIREIADALGVSEEAAKKQIQRGLARMRAMLSEEAVT